MNKRELGLSIKAHRDSLGIGQAEYGAMFGVKINSVSRWESGTKSPSGPRLLAIQERMERDGFRMTAGGQTRAGPSRMQRLPPSSRRPVARKQGRCWQGCTPD